jgi:type VI secretion system secreted protein VgrG
LTSPGDATTYGEAYHYADNYLTPGSAYDLNPAPESGAFYARIRHERYLNGQTQTRAITSSPALSPGMLLKVTGGYEVADVFAHGVVITAMHTMPAVIRTLRLILTAFRTARILASVLSPAHVR